MPLRMPLLGPWHEPLSSSSAWARRSSEQTRVPAQRAGPEAEVSCAEWAAAGSLPLSSHTRDPTQAAVLKLQHAKGCAHVPRAFAPPHDW